jgi:hypothetical protein
VYWTFESRLPDPALVRDGSAAADGRRYAVGDAAGRWVGAVAGILAAAAAGEPDGASAGSDDSSRLLLEIRGIGTYEMRLEWPLLSSCLRMQGWVAREGDTLTFTPEQQGAIAEPFRGTVRPGVLLILSQRGAVRFRRAEGSA